MIHIKPADGDVHKLLIKQKAITSIALRLTNQKNTDISLNGLDYDVSIKLEFIETKKLNSGPLSIRQQLTDHKEQKEQKEKTKTKKTISTKKKKIVSSK